MGKRAKEKRLRKIAQEEKMKRFGGNELQIGLLDVMQEQQKRLGSAHIVLKGSQKR